LLVIIVELLVALVRLIRFLTDFFVLFFWDGHVLVHAGNCTRPRAKPRSMNLARAAIETPLGVTLHVVSDGDCIRSADFSRRAVVSAQRTRDALLREAARQVRAYFGKRLRRFDLPLHFEGTAFQKDVWSFVAGLEAGQLVSYGDLARLIGRPRAHRGVAAAMRLTPIDLFVPAHRVVGSDGTVRGAGANSVRRRLLAFEGITLK
jgi:methylated-DNA-[protein]-cysteine S-methyltransferase